MTDFAKYKRLTIPEGKVKIITRKRDGLLLWKAGYINLVPLSINADGSIYNGIGYKNGYRVRSGGAEIAESGVSCSGFMKVNGLSVVRVAGCTWPDGTHTAINVSDESFINLGQVVGNSNGYGIFSDKYTAYNSETVVQKDNYWEWVVPPAESGVVYIRVTGNVNDGSTLIVTVDEEIEI